MNTSFLSRAASGQQCTSSELCRSQVFEKVSNDKDCASCGRREEQKADSQPEESTNTLKPAFSFIPAEILMCWTRGGQINVRAASADGRGSSLQTTLL